MTISNELRVACTIFRNILANSPHADKVELFEATCSDAAHESNAALAECLKTWADDFDDNFETFDALTADPQEHTTLPAGWKQYLLTLDDTGNIVALDKLNN